MWIRRRLIAWRRQVAGRRHVAGRRLAARRRLFAWRILVTWRRLVAWGDIVRRRDAVGRGGARQAAAGRSGARQAAAGRRDAVTRRCGAPRSQCWFGPSARRLHGRRGLRGGRLQFKEHVAPLVEDRVCKGITRVARVTIQPVTLEVVLEFMADVLQIRNVWSTLR